MSLNGLNSNWEPVVTLISTLCKVKVSLLTDIVQVTLCGPNIHKMKIIQSRCPSHLTHLEHLCSDENII